MDLKYILSEDMPIPNGSSLSKPGVFYHLKRPLENMSNSALPFKKRHLKKTRRFQGESIPLFLYGGYSYVSVYDIFSKILQLTGTTKNDYELTRLAQNFRRIHKDKYKVFLTLSMINEFPAQNVHFPRSKCGMFIRADQIIMENGFFHEYLVLDRKIKFDTRPSFFIKQSVPLSMNTLFSMTK